MRCRHTLAFSSLLLALGSPSWTSMADLRCIGSKRQMPNGETIGSIWRPTLTGTETTRQIVKIKTDRKAKKTGRKKRPLQKTVLFSICT